MRLLICGDRDWIDERLIYDEILALKPDVIIEGEARGADTIAMDIGNALGIKVLPFPADWGRYGRAAGQIRNTQMLVEGKPDKVLAFHDDIIRSKGTRNMIGQCIKKGIDVKLISHEVSTP